MKRGLSCLADMNEWVVWDRLRPELSAGRRDDRIRFGVEGVCRVAKRIRRQKMEGKNGKSKLALEFDRVGSVRRAKIRGTQGESSPRRGEGETKGGRTSKFT